MLRGLDTLRHVHWEKLTDNERKAHEGQLLILSALFSNQKAFEQRLANIEESDQGSANGVCKVVTHRPERGRSGAFPGTFSTAPPIPGRSTGALKRGDRMSRRLGKLFGLLDPEGRVVSVVRALKKAGYKFIEVELTERRGEVLTPETQKFTPKTKAKTISLDLPPRSPRLPEPQPMLRRSRSPRSST